MGIGIDFADIISYTENMAKGMDDKLYFLSKIAFDKKEKYLFVDFGCADGAMISAVYEILHDRGINSYFIGYDISEEMINLAKTKFAFDTQEVLFTSCWDSVDNLVKSMFKGYKKILILSSVIHELYSYSKFEYEITEFWDRVTNSGFDYICLRDMMCSYDADRPTSTLMVNKFYDKIKDSPMMKSLLNSFESVWGSVDNNKNFMHFMLKYRWKINWDREVNENYFPRYLDEIMGKFDNNYNVSYMERFRVPFLDDCIKKDFDITLSDYTHVKAVFEKKKEG